MKSCWKLSLTLLALLIAAIGQAGEVTSCFGNGKLNECSHQVLQHVPFKAVVLQFVDPDQTGLGETLSRLFWREILESISDVSGAGVILAYDKNGAIEDALEDKDIDQFLQNEYHRAAQAIAEQQGAQISIWGAVLKDGDDLLIQPFLTMRQTEQDPWSTFSWTLSYPRGISLSSPLGRQRLNLAPVHTSRSELFERPFVTRCQLSTGCPQGVDLRAAPSNQSAVIDHVPVGSQVQVIDAERQWLKLRRAGQVDAWINIYHLEMFPGEIHFLSRSNVNLRKTPAGELVAKVNLNGRYTVLHGQRYGSYDEPWYRIQVGEHRGWVAGRLVNQRSFTFPAVHLIAGLLRYGRLRYQAASRDFATFLDQSEDEDNVTRSTALQFQAASIAAESAGRRNAEALALLAKAKTQTPFDSRVYSLSTVLAASTRRGMMPALEDLAGALKLNPRDPDTRQLLNTLVQVQESHGLQVLNPDLINRDDAKQMLKGMEKGIQP